MTKMTKNKNGFTLLEVIVSMAVISVGILGALALTNYSISSAVFAKNQLISANLAQEQIEVVRNIRDSNWLGGVSWKDKIPQGTNLNVDYNSTQLSDLPDGLFFDGLRYLHSTTPNTPFSRHLEIAYKIDGDGYEYIQVKSVVEWKDRGRVHKILAIDHLYDWR
jgi:prepilin-type N-terminal cleavage/methylation domain-containing protein